MEINFILLGMAFFAAAELYLAARAWRLGLYQFSLSLFLPGYGYLLARRKAFYWPYYAIMACGAASFLAAAVASTFA